MRLLRLSQGVIDMNNSLSRIFCLANRNLKEMIREPLSLIFLIVVPLAMEIAFFFIFHELTSQFEIKYLAPGIVVFSQAFITLFSGLLISQDRNSRFLTRLYVTKTRSFEFIFGYVFALLPIVLVQSVLFFLVGGIIDSSFWSVGMIYGILMSVVTSVFFIAFGILFGSICNEKAIGGISSIIIVGQSVLSGMWFPKEGLKDGFITFMQALPFKNASMSVENVVNGYSNAFDDIILPLIILMSYTIVVMIVAILVFKHKMKSK